MLIRTSSNRANHLMDSSRILSIRYKLFNQNWSSFFFPLRFSAQVHCIGYVRVRRKGKQAIKQTKQANKQTNRFPVFRIEGDKQNNNNNEDKEKVNRLQKRSQISDSYKKNKFNIHLHLTLTFASWARVSPPSGTVAWLPFTSMGCGVSSE